MPITPETSAQFQTDLATFVTNYNTANGTNYDIANGTVLKDILIDAPSIEFGNLSSSIATDSEIPSVNYAATNSNQDVSDLASNFNLVRLPAVSSSGSADFIATVMPTSNITVNAGTIISVPATSASPQIQFQVTSTVVMNAANLAPYAFINASLQTNWKITATISAISSGSSGNVGAFTITQLNQPVSGITLIQNPNATNGGMDQESNAELGLRIQLKLSGNNVGTTNGITSLMLTNGSVSDVSVVGPQDPEMLRNQYGGSVDVYVLGSNPTTTVEMDNYTGTSFIKLSNTPVISVASVTGIVSGLPFVFTLGTDAVFVKDEELLTGSSKESSYINFPTITKPDIGTTVNTTLVYDSLIPTLQNLINSSSNNVVTSDILIREPQKITVNVYAKISIFSGFVPVNVAAAVHTVISTYIESKKLGQGVDPSQMIVLIEGVPGVNTVDLPSFVPATPVSIGKNQIANIGTLQVQIGLTIY